MNAIVACTFVVVLAIPAGNAYSQVSTGGLRWSLRLNETTGPIRTADVSPPSRNEAASEILAGPISGSDNAYFDLHPHDAGGAWTGALHASS